MNATEGTRRVALVVGFVGCTVGLFAELSPAAHIWSRVAAHRRYVKLMSLPFMRELVPRLSPRSEYSVPDGFVAPYGIKTVRVFARGEVSIELITGRVESDYYRHEGPSISDFAGLTFWPVIGFIFPWGVVRTVTWVVTWVRQGFTAT